MKLLIPILTILLTGCATFPVGSLGVCIGVCTIKMDSKPLTPAEAIGGGLANLAMEAVRNSKR